MNGKSPTKIVALGGSLRDGSYSLAAMRAAATAAQEMGTAFELLDLRQLALPMYVPDLALDDYPAGSRAAIDRMLAAFRGADAMLWVTPAYHGAMSGVFKNAIDYMEFLADDARAYLQGCAVGLVMLSDDSPAAGLASCAHELRAWLAPTRVTLDATDFSPGPILSSESGTRRLARLVAELAGTA